MIQKIKTFHILLILLLISILSCDQLSEDTSPPMLSEETFRILLFNENTEQYDSIITALGGVNNDPIVAPNEVVLNGLFSDNVLLDRLEFKVTAQNPGNEHEDQLYSKSTTIEDFELPVLGTSTSSFKTLDIPESVAGNTYDYLMIVYDEKGNVSKDYTWSLIVENTNPLIKINQIATEYSPGDVLTIEGSITSGSTLVEASISFGEKIISPIEVGENQTEVPFNQTITFLVSDASSDPQNLIISATDNEKKVGQLVVSLLIQ